jgi:hypothetical protein
MPGDSFARRILRRGGWLLYSIGWWCAGSGILIISRRKVFVWHSR